jgi:hypothetical protein
MSDQAIEQSLEDRMVNFLDAEEGIEEEVPEVVAAEEEEPTEELEEEAEEEESEEEQPSATVRLKVNGEEIEKPLEEVIALAQQGMDYTQKTQKVAEERRELENYAQTIKVQEQQLQESVQVQQALIQDIAQLTAIDNQLSQYQQVNWDQLNESDPVEAQRLFFKYSQLQTQRGQMANVLTQKQQQIAQQQAQRTQQLLHEGQEVLKRDIPGWSQEKAREIFTEAKHYGFVDDELSRVTDPRVVKALHDALQWRKLQANPTAKQKVAQAKPIVKPGAKDTKQQATSQTRALREQLRKTGDDKAAAKLIERLL